MAKLNIRNRNQGQFDKNGKLKAPNWEYRFEAAKIDGKRKSISKSGFKTKKEAEIAGAAALSDYSKTGSRFESSDMSLSDFLDYWFDNYVKVSCKYNTQVNYRNVIDNHLKPVLGKYALKSITPMQIQEYVNHKFSNGLKKHTVVGIISVLSGALKYAVIPCKLIQSSPAEYVKYPKQTSAKSETNRIVISVENFDKIIKRFAPGNPFRYALLIGFYTGMRISEVFGLTWDDIDLKQGTIDITKICYKRTNKEKKSKEEKPAWYFGTPKTKSSVRKIKIGETLVNELKAYKVMQKENQLLYGEYYTQVYQKAELDEKGNTIMRLIEVEKTVPVILPLANMVMRRENGQYISTDSFKYAARVIHYDLGMEFNFHSLRHTHATMLIESGVSVKAVQERLGHENIETTLQTYVHNTKQMEEEAVNVFEKVVQSRHA